MLFKLFSVKTLSPVEEMSAKDGEEWQKEDIQSISLSSGKFFFCTIHLQRSKRRFQSNNALSDPTFDVRPVSFMVQWSRSTSHISPLLSLSSANEQVRK